MKISSPLLLSLGAAVAQASPVEKRAGITDADILNYALTLEHLEATFYEEGFKNYTHEDFVKAGCKDPIFANVQKVGSDEKAHEQFLTQALSGAGAKPVERCTYSFPSTDVKSFLALGSMLEGVGVSAYLGAAAHIMNDTYLSAAGSILSVEARHSAYLRAALGESPYAQPFDNPLDFNEVYTLASAFIMSCPESNGKLPVKAFPTLTMDMSSGMTAMAGDMVKVMAGEGFDKMNATDVHAAFITATGPMWTPVKPAGKDTFMVTIPKGIAGQSYVVLTCGDSQATDDNIVAGPAIIEVGMAKSTSSSMGSGMSSGMAGMGSMSMGSMSMSSMGSMSTGVAGVGASMKPSGSMLMPSGSMMMPSASMTPGASGSTSSSMPMFTGGASKTLNGAAGAFGVGAAAVAAVLM